MKLFERDSAIVTGAGKGIGRAIACALVREGVSTVFADLAMQDAHAASAEVLDLDARAIPWSGDLAVPSERERLLAEAREALGPVTLFVHSASPRDREKDHLFAVDFDTWRLMHAVNLEAAFHLGRDLARDMVDSGIHGSMLMVTSLHAATPRNLPHYSTAKAGMAILVKEFARALGPHGIRVNALVPGAVPRAGVVTTARMARHVPLGRLGRPDDLAPMALAVLSNRVGGYVTGAEIVVDGGLSLTNWITPPLFEDLR